MTKGDECDPHQKDFLLCHEMRILGVVRPVGVVEGELVLGSSLSEGVSFAPILFGDRVQKDGAVVHRHRRSTVQIDFPGNRKKKQLERKSGQNHNTCM